MSEKKISYFLDMYFEKWQSMDNEGTLELLDEDCKLIDWEINLNSKKQIANHNYKFFEQVEKINLKIINQSISEFITFTHLNLEIDNEKLNVVDIITFNDKNMITKIEAFKC